jgi:DNA-binding transcriptional LysR family regulator
VVAVPSGHPLSRSRNGRVAFARLAAERFVLATGRCAIHARSLAWAAGLELADVRVEVRDWASAFALVREGVGVTLVPEPTLPEDRRGLRVLHLADPLYRRFGLQVSSRARGSPAVRALLEVAAAGHPHAGAARDTGVASTAVA